MIKKFAGYDDIQIFEGGASIEPGGYELQIIGAKVEQYTSKTTGATEDDPCPAISIAPPLLDTT